MVIKCLFHNLRTSGLLVFIIDLASFNSKLKGNLHSKYTIDKILQISILRKLHLFMTIRLKVLTHSFGLLIIICCMSKQNQNSNLLSYHILLIWLITIHYIVYKIGIQPINLWQQLRIQYYNLVRTMFGYIISKDILTCPIQLVLMTAISFLIKNIL